MGAGLRRWGSLPRTISPAEYRRETLRCSGSNSAPPCSGVSRRFSVYSQPLGWAGKSAAAHIYGPGPKFKAKEIRCDREKRERNSGPPFSIITKGNLARELFIKDNTIRINKYLERNPQKDNLIRVKEI